MRSEPSAASGDTSRHQRPRFASIESWFNSFKSERVHGLCYTTKEAMKAMSFEYIEVFYKRKRLHLALGYKPPMQFGATGSFWLLRLEQATLPV